MTIKLVTLLFIFLLIDYTYPQDKLAKLNEYYHNKCYSHTKNVTYFEKLSTNSATLMASLGESSSKIPDHGEEFCKNNRKELNSKATLVAEALKPCLSSQEKFFSDFVETSFKEFTHFLCHNNGEHMKSLFSARNTECRQRLGNDTDIKSRLTNCFGRIFAPNSGHPTKKEVCDDISVAEKCITTILQDKCNNTTSSYKHLNQVFFQYIQKACAGIISEPSGSISITNNVFLLILTVILSYVFGKN